MYRTHAAQLAVHVLVGHRHAAVDQRPYAQVGLVPLRGPVERQVRQQARGAKCVEIGLEL